jgi:hypothetical protein
MAHCLLMCHEGVNQNTFPLTHEFLARMVGVRRATVTLPSARLSEPVWHCFGADW